MSPHVVGSENALFMQFSIIFSKNFLSVKFSEKFCTVFHIPSVLNQTV